MIMVKVWFVREGPKPTNGGPAYELPLATCVELLGLTADHFLSGLECTPRFGGETARLGSIAGWRFVALQGVKQTF